ncbi:MAG TPA: hypothetical protein VH186_21085 [Chloroflexia bacterium]|nr:hypothetical protein [Chloroflexia bacterium]
MSGGTVFARTGQAYSAGEPDAGDGCFFLLPRNLHPRPKDLRNEPAYLLQVLNTVASCYGRDSSRNYSHLAGPFSGSPDY